MRVVYRRKARRRVVQWNQIGIRDAPKFRRQRCRVENARRYARCVRNVYSTLSGRAVSFVAFPNVAWPPAASDRQTPLPTRTRTFARAPSAADVRAGVQNPARQPKTALDSPSVVVVVVFSMSTVFFFFRRPGALSGQTTGAPPPLSGPRRR